MNDEVKKKKKIFPWQRTLKLPEKTDSGWGGWQRWIGVLLVFLTLEIAVLSVEQAQWVSPQPSLSLVLFLSLFTCVILTRIRIYGLIKLIPAVAIGFIVVVWQSMSVLTVPETTSRLSHFIDVVASWFQGAAGLLPGDEKIMFVMFITALTWVIGYLSVWFVLRWNNAWVAVILGGLVILFNLTNLPDSYYIYFFLYFFAAALLVAATRMTGLSLIAGRIANYSSGSLLYLGISLLCIVALAASFSWIMPQVRATGLQDFIATKLPWQKDVLDSKYNIFNVVPSKQALSTSITLKDLSFEERWNQGSDIEYIIYSETPAYWRINVYDTYTIDGWTNSPTEKTLLEANAPWVDIEELPDEEVVEYAVSAEIFTDVLITSGGFISADVPVWISVGAGEQVEAINSARLLSPGEGYTITTRVASSTASDLSDAGTQYPEFIKENYLQLPDDIADDIRRLSENVTGSAATPYAKAVAIVDYLSQFPYTLEIDLPPEGVDSVSYFLFTRQNGYCLHYASAMVLMLRSLDVPARLAVGYLPGEPGNIPGQYLLRDKFYHTWPQVYFPDYGWVDMEATPGSLENTVPIDTPLVSTDAIRQSQYYDYLWRGALFPDVQDIHEIGLENMPGQGVIDVGGDSLSFAAKLGRVMLFVLGGAVIIALLIGIVLLVRALSFRWLWRVEREVLAYDTYVNMCRLASMAGIAPRPNQTPLEYSRDLVQAYPDHAASLSFITRAYMDSRFGGRGKSLAMAEEAEILKARHLVYTAILQQFGWIRKFFGKK